MVRNAAVAAAQRLCGLWFTLLQTSVAAGLAWYIAHDVLNHSQPFFAPVAAVVCLSASNVLRAQRAVQMMIGVALGIGIGAIVQLPLGTGVVAIVVAAFIALSVAVSIGHGFVGQGLMFINQTAVSTILVLTLSHSGVISERICDAVIGGGLALVFSILLFPANPVTVLRNERAGVLVVLHDTVDRAVSIGTGSTAPPRDWPSSAVDRVHQQLSELIAARTTARQIVRFAPRRWRTRDSVTNADQQAAQVALFAVSVLHLARAVTSAPQSCDMDAALTHLAAGTAVADTDPVVAAAHVADARSQAAELHSIVRGRAEVALAEAVQACVEDLQRVLDLRCQGHPVGRGESASRRIRCAWYRVCGRSRSTFFSKSGG